MNNLIIMQTFFIHYYLRSQESVVKQVPPLLLVIYHVHDCKVTLEETMHLKMHVILKKSSQDCFAKKLIFSESMNLNTKLF